MIQPVQDFDAIFYRRITRRAEIMTALFVGTKLIYIEVVGRLMLAELLAVVGLLTVNVSAFIKQQPALRAILFGYVIFLVGLIISDYYNESLTKDYLRGWAAIGFGMISTIFLTVQMTINHRAVYVYLVITVVTAIFFKEGSLDMAYLEQNSNYFKTTFVPVLLPGLTLAACLLWTRNRVSAAILLFVSGVVFVGFDARSSGGGLVLGSMLLLAQIFNFRPQPQKILFASLIIGACSYFGYVYYVNQVLYHGVGGSNAQQLREIENPYNPVELLLIGRASVVVASTAIKDRPVLGFGSWAKDETGEYGLLYGSLKGMDYFVHPLGIIPAHSMLLAAWLWAGILGFVGMGIVGIIMLRLFLSSFWIYSPLTPVICVYFIDTAWAFFFSPIGSIRTSFPFAIALLIVSANGALVSRQQMLSQQ